MNFSDFTTSGIGGIFNSFWFVFTHGGWVAFIILTGYMLWNMYMDEIQGQFKNAQEWVYLNIKIPKENIVSLLSVEQIFAQLHALHVGYTFAELYIEGRIQLWYSLEIVSFGGKISFIIRAPRKARDLVEAAVYAEYPTAEISETADYLANVTYDPETSEFDLWGTEFRLLDHTSLPIRTYREFEHSNHPTAEEKIVDPLAQLFESLSKMQPHEFFGVQILIRPLADDEWKPAGEKKAKELLGEKVPKDIGFWDIILKPINAFAEFSFAGLFGVGTKAPEVDNKAKNNLLHMTEVEKERVNAIQRKISKPGYKTKIRYLYIAPKDRFDGSKKTMMVGCFRPLGSAYANRLKPDVSTTWTNVNYMFSPTLEAPYLNWAIRERKRRLFDGYKGRSFTIGRDPFIMNTEEIATMFHLPISTDAAVPPMEIVESKKSQPPVNLPVGEF